MFYFFLILQNLIEVNKKRNEKCVALKVFFSVQIIHVN